MNDTGDAEMSIYTANGDKGTTNLVRTKNVSKSDDRIQLVGTIDELTSHLGLIKTMMNEESEIRFLETIQKNLSAVVSGVADPFTETTEQKTTRPDSWKQKSAVWKVCSTAHRKKMFFRAGTVCRQNWISREQLRGEQSAIWQLSV